MRFYYAMLVYRQRESNTTSLPVSNTGENDSLADVDDVGLQNDD